MNEQLQTALAEMIGKANAGIDAGTSFLQAQLPDVIQQLLVWKLAQNVLMAAFMLLAIWGLVNLLLVIHRADSVGLWRREPAYSWEKDTAPMSSIAYMAAFVSLLAIALMSFAAVTRLLTAVQLWLAPKVYLIEYAASLTK